MIKKFITSNPLHKKIVPFLDWIMLLRIEKMLAVWALICVGMYIGSILNNSTIINATDYSFDTFIFFFGCSLLCGGIFIIQEANEFKIRNNNNNLFNHIDIVDIGKSKIIGDIVAVIGTLLVLYINFFSILLSIIYLLNRFFIKDGSILSISLKSTSLIFNLFIGISLMKMGFIYVFINSMSDIISSTLVIIYAIPFTLGLCSVCIFINELEFNSEKSQNMYILALIFCLLSVSIGLKLNEPLFSVSGVTVLPFYLFAVLRGKYKDIVRSVRYSILIFNFYILTIYPLLFFPLIITYYLSKYYNWHRLNFHYPTFLVDEKLTYDYNTISRFRIEKND